ncbi:MAG: LysM domain-containing protein [Chitinophagaceae bacterium]
MQENEDILKPTEKDTKTTIASEYTIEERDTVADIENKLGISWQEIEAANKDVLQEGDALFAGMRLKIPTKE